MDGVDDGQAGASTRLTPASADSGLDKAEVPADKHIPACANLSREPPGRFTVKTYMTPTESRSIPTTHSHADISRQARQLWQDRGCPTGCDEAIWLETERQMQGKLKADLKGDTFAASALTKTAAENLAGYELPPAATEKEAITALQKQEARAPQVAKHNRQKDKPAETGKPLWDKPHSS